MLRSASPDAVGEADSLPLANILLVDDYPPNLRVLEVVLESLGQRTVRASSGEEALERLQKEEFAVVLLDVMMPGLDGLATAERVRAQQPGREVPIILMTAGDTPALEGYAHGAVDVLRKPIEAGVVRAKVSVFLELFRARQLIQRHAARVEAQERTAQARTAALLNASLDAVIGMDHEGRITEFNASAEGMFGWPRAQALGCSLADLLIPAPQRAAHGRGLARYLASGETRVLDRRIELEALRRDGSTFPIELAIRRVATDGPPSFLGYARDLTARKSTERAQAFLVQASEALAASLDYQVALQTVVRLAVPTIADSAAIYRHEEDGKITLVALAARDEPTSVLMRELDALLPLQIEDDRTLTRVVRNRRPELLSMLSAPLRESWSPTSRASEILEQLAFRSYMVVPLLARGRSFGAVALTTSEGRELTHADLELAEELARRAGLAIENAELYREAQQANRLKDEFLATVSHELRTPLTAILGWLHLLRSGSPEQVARGVDTIERNALAQARIVEDLLDVSRIVTGKLRLQLEPMQLTDVVQAAIDTVRPTATAKGIELSTEVAPGAGELVGDPARLQQVVWNLLVNAIKFTPKRGSVQVFLSRQGSGVQLSVKDSGKGIRADFLPHIFQRFRQEDNTSTRAHGGLGLGLAIVRHLVEAHGGHVAAASEGEGQGATFTVVLPSRPPGASEPPPA
ncbi:MAG: hypothetical protein RL685_6428 [Pseudomonadota bacterium]